MTYVGQHWRSWLLRLALGLGSLILNPTLSLAQSCNLTLSPGANITTVVSLAPAGFTICLVSGNYGTLTLNGVVKNPRVTIRSTTEQGATFGLVIQNGTNGITIGSATITDSRITGATTKNITVSNSVFNGPAVFDELVNSNVLFDRNTHNNINAGAFGASAARLHLAYGGSMHSGVTIQNSTMDGGSTDGVQTGTGVNILNNTFLNITEGSCSECHTDAIQMIGTTVAGSVIRGNFIYNCETGIVGYDRMANVTIEGNVIKTRGRPWGIELYSDSDSIIRHNTLLYQSGCYYNQVCGVIALDHKSSDPPGKGTVIVDNIATTISASNGSTFGERHHNLLRSGAASGDLSGASTFVGGATPTTMAGFQLAVGSLGKGAASSPAGADVGAIYIQRPAAPPAPATDVRIVR